MPVVIFYFQMHQPFCLHPERDSFFWEERNREIFLERSNDSYLPALGMFTRMIMEHPAFKLSLGMSGTFLKQAELFCPEVIASLHALFDAGEPAGQVECLDETYYHSLTSLYSDPQKQEFRDQISLHRDKLRMLFGIAPVCFRNTSFLYNDQIAEIVTDMGYRAILCDDLKERDNEAGTPRKLKDVFSPPGSKLIVISRNSPITTNLLTRFLPSPNDFAASLASHEGDVVLLTFDLEHIGGDIPGEKGVVTFWQELPAALEAFPQVSVLTPGEIARQFRRKKLPTRSVPELTNYSWIEKEGDAATHMGKRAQQALFQDIERLEGDARHAGGELLQHWRNLTASDHISILDEEDCARSISNPYGSLVSPAHILTRKIDYLEMAVKRFSTFVKRETTAILMISPETGRLPAGMGGLAKYISGKTGGQGEVVSALCEGLTERGIHVHLITLNLKKRFREEAHLSEQQWQQLRYTIDPQNIHLVSSSLFADKLSAYSGDSLLTAAEFQKEIVNNLIKSVRARHQGLIIHSHDWMAGGAITAYAKARGLSTLHTVHNVFTENLPLDYLHGVDRQGLADYLFLNRIDGTSCIDCQATAIKNATIINFVGQRFLKEVVDDYFLDVNVVPSSVRNEVKAKYYSGAAWSIINAPSSTIYPERCEYLVKRYGPQDDILRAKGENLAAFQQRTGLRVDPTAILFYWPSRLDPVQKGVDLLEQVALPFVTRYQDAQIAIVADGIGNDPRHRTYLGGLAVASEGRITYQHFSEELSLLGYAAAHDVFGASLYEPCGQIDQLGNIFGATATNRDTGGYHDKIRELRMKIDGAPQDVGNGFLFRDYDPGGLWYAMEKSLFFHRLAPEIRLKQITRIMKEAREQYDLGKMIAAYIRIYEKLNQGKPLT